MESKTQWPNSQTRADANPGTPRRKNKQEISRKGESTQRYERSERRENKEIPENRNSSITREILDGDCFRPFISIVQPGI